MRRSRTARRRQCWQIIRNSLLVIAAIAFGAVISRLVNASSERDLSGVCATYLELAVELGERNQHPIHRGIVYRRGQPVGVHQLWTDPQSLDWTTLLVFDAKPHVMACVLDQGTDLEPTLDHD